jgi:poly-gamma-glutamate capsule biosynthesis protein CapA/YwtB (metallophosphatase superfamily)
MQSNQHMLKTGGISLFILLSFFYGIYGVGDKPFESVQTETVFVSEDTTSKDISLFFVGDMMGHEPMIGAAFNDSIGVYEYAHWFQYIQEFVHSFDYTCANLEVTLAGKPYTGYPQFSSPDAFAKGIYSAGFNIFVTANNHSQDRGKKGVERTIHTLDSLGITHTGTFLDTLSRDQQYPLIQEVKGVKIALLNCTYGTNGLVVQHPNVVNMIDTLQIRKDLKKAVERGAQFTVVNIHWGSEYQRKENSEQDKLAQWLTDAGADAIIGLHPHVVQPMQILHPKSDSTKNVHVAYSLGNFISYQRERYKDGGIGVVLHLKVKNKKVQWDTWGFVPFWCRVGGNPRGYYSVSVSDWELHPEKYDLSSEEKVKISTFVEDTRELLKDIQEIKVK